MARILLIDDDQNIRELLKSYLETKGHSVVTSSDGWDGIRELMTSAPDVILMDINMPKMNGIQAMDLIKSSHLADKVPLIVTSAEGDQETILRTVQLGATDFVVKPYSFADLESRILKLLETPR